MQQGKMVVWRGLTNSWEEKWKQRRKGKIHPSECRVLKNSKESEQCKKKKKEEEEEEEKNRMWKIRDYKN